MSKTLSRIFNNIYPFADFLYILQLEEYDSKRYFKRLKLFFFKRNLQRRGHLIHTFRVKITLICTLPLGLLTPPLIPLWIGAVNLIVNPFIEYFKTRLQNNASKYFRQVNTDTKVIVIAGSYGKTTVKNYIYELVRYNYKTQMIPGNINTPTGIADWILKHFDLSTEILIVEVDTYYPGEIKKSLRITPPDIAILTNIADQHLERFKDRKQLRTALLEVFQCAKKGSIKIKNEQTSLAYALRVAKILHIPKDIVDHIVKNLEIPQRRGNFLQISGFDVIDNSYNINSDIAQESITSAKKIALGKKKKLIVISAGIPELGYENRKGNFNLGESLDKHAVKIILLRSIFANQVESGIKNKNKIIFAESMNTAYKILEKYDPKKYLILIQPELTDLYYVK